MKTLSLRNEFHGTETHIRLSQFPTSSRHAGLYRVTRQQALRAKRALCGIAGCVCGGAFGERGTQPCPFEIINETYDHEYVLEIHKEPEVDYSYLA